MTAIIGGPHVAVSDDDLVRFSETNPGWSFERADDGALLVSPTSTNGGPKSGEAYVQLYTYAKRVGGKAYDAATGFKTPAGGVVCPDAAWVREERVIQHAHETGFWQIIPDVAIEVASTSDEWSRITKKIEKYVRDGAVYAIAIDPQSRATFARGECPSGLTLDLDAIMDA